MEAETNLILVRGVSGAGKNTIGDLFNEDDTTVVISTDDMFMINDEYVFDASKLSEYHKKTVDHVEEIMKDYAWMSIDSDFSWSLVNKIVVCNTFTEEWEMKSYFDIAKEYKWRVHTIIVENRHKSSSIHNVPAETITKQRIRFEVIL